MINNILEAINNDLARDAYNGFHIILDRWSSDNGGRTTVVGVVSLRYVWLQGLFAWQAEYFYHVNPYAFRDYDHKLKEEDFVSDELGKRIGPDVSQPVK